MQTAIQDRLTMLEQELAQLRAELALRPSVTTEAPNPTIAAMPAPSAPTPSVRPPSASPRGKGRSSRRTFFKAGVAVAGAAVATPLLARSAVADDGGNMLIGRNNTSAAGDTRLVAGAGAPIANVNIMTVSDSGTSSGFEAAIGAYAQGVRIRNGLYAFTNVRDEANSATGHAIVARAESGSRSNILLTPSSGDPRADTFSHRRGEMRSDATGRLWFCIDSGTPGTWRKLAGVDSAGALHVTQPTRVYDSRFVDGPVANGASRLVTVANAINISTGAISQFNFVPTGAIAVIFNLAVVNTVGVGFLSATPGTAGSFTAASINWFGSGQVLNNGTQSTIDTNRQLRIWAGGAADFVIDITGYTL